jgi:hypothetical protein
MDPTQCLKEIRELVVACQKSPGDLISAGDLADHFDALDKWLTRGGHLPWQWEENRWKETP